MKEKISSMRNLGPTVERDFNAIGIYYADEIIMLGEKKSFLRLIEGRKANGKSTQCYNACYLYALYGAIHDLAWQDIPEDKKNEFKAFTAELRSRNNW